MFPSGQLNARDLAYLLGGFLLFGLVAVVTPIDLTALKDSAVLAAPVLTAVAYVVGYSLQECGSFLQLYKVSTTFEHNRLDKWFASKFIGGFHSGNYRALTRKEERAFAVLQMKSANIERINYLRSMCFVTGDVLLVGALVTVGSGLLLGWNSMKVAVLACELPLSIFILMRGRVESMQIQYYARIAVLDASAKAESSMTTQG
jgi:hypothetical protein